MLFCGTVGFGVELGGFVIISSSREGLANLGVLCSSAREFRELLRFLHRIRKGFPLGAATPRSPNPYILYPYTQRGLPQSLSTNS
jgi:hypothetical protein